MPIYLRLEWCAGQYRIEIEDRGAGIQPAVLAALERGESITTKPDGNGIGVSSSVRWAKENGYGLTFRSEQNVGTTVSLSIPG